MDWGTRLLFLGGVMVVIFAANLIAQQIMPTKVGDNHAIAYRYLVLIIFFAIGGLVIAIGFAVSG